MSSRARIGARDGSAQEVDVSTWPEVDADALTDARRQDFLLRRKAINLYLAGATDEELRQETGQSRTNG